MKSPCAGEQWSRCKRSKDRLNLALEAAQMGTWELNIVTGTVWKSRLHDLNLWIRRFQPNVESGNAPAACGARRLAPNAEKGVRTVARNGPDQGEWRIIRANDRAERWIRFEGQIYRRLRR